MTVQRFYRLAIWLPLFVPTLVAVAFQGLAVFSKESVGLLINGPASWLVQMLLASLLYGGVPYALLAVWATVRVGGRTEAQIRRLMFLSPLIMAAFYVPFAVVVGFAVGGPPAVFLSVGGLGAVVTIPVGYTYVGVVALIREQIGLRLLEAPR